VNLLEVLPLAVALAMDAFAISIVPVFSIRDVQSLI